MKSRSKGAGLATVAIAAVAVAAVAFGAAACDPCDGPDVLDELTIRSQGDIEELDGVACVLGDISVGEDGLLVDEPLDFGRAAEDLLIVEGDITIFSTSQMTTLSLPSLQWAGRRGLDRDGADGIRGGFFVENNTALARVDLPELTDVGGCFEFEDNPLLDSAEVDDLLDQVKSHAFPGTCDGDIEKNIGNGVGR